MAFISIFPVKNELLIHWLLWDLSAECSSSRARSQVSGRVTLHLGDRILLSSRSKCLTLALAGTCNQEPAQVRAVPGSSQCSGCWISLSAQSHCHNSTAMCDAIINIGPHPPVPWPIFLYGHSFWQKGTKVVVNAIQYEVWQQINYKGWSIIFLYTQIFYLGLFRYLKWR